MLTKVFHLNALSALHVGVGQAIGVVDLPIARAKSTNLPIVPGSAIKGVLRDEFAAHEKQAALFGPEKIDEGASGHASALAFGDAHLLILPVRSMAGVVAYATSPFVLARYAEDCKRSGQTNLPSIPKQESGVSICQGSKLKASNNQVILEDLDLVVGQGADKWADFIAKKIYPDNHEWQTLFKERFAILSDDDFSFLADTATEVRARIKINNETGVVQKGALWYEENLPADSVLWGVMASGQSRDKNTVLDKEGVWQQFRAQVGQDKTIQIGGKATVGRGLVCFVCGE